MKIIKQLAKFSLFSIIVFFICIMALRGIGIVTDDALLSNESMMPLPQISEDDNAYNLISDIDQSGFDVRNEQHLLNSLLRQWDEPQAVALLQRQQFNLDLLTSTLEKPAFNSRALLSVDLPNYSSMIFLADLALLKAKYFEHNGSYSQAFEYLSISLKFSQLIKHDANSVLMSYQISQAQQRKALSQLAEMVQRADIQERVLANLSVELSRLDDYTDDGFDLVWSGEQLYSQLMLDQFIGESIFERLETYDLRLQWRDGRVIDWHAIALILIPEYVLQRGKQRKISQAFYVGICRFTRRRPKKAYLGLTT